MQLDRIKCGVRIRGAVLAMLWGWLGCTEVSGTLSGDLSDGVPFYARRIFMTTIAGSTGGFAATTGSIDGPCALARTAAGLQHTYIAILSTSTLNAKDRLTGDRPIYKVLGNEPILVADNADQMWTGSPRLRSPIDTDELGVKHTLVSLRAWTGSTVNGVFDPTRTCADWTNPAFGTGGNIGKYDETGIEWIRIGNSVDCDPSPGLRGIYCISI
jgi:hypothetical protein